MSFNTLHYLLFVVPVRQKLFKCNVGPLMKVTSVHMEAMGRCMIDVYINHVSWTLCNDMLILLLILEE